MEYKLIGSSPCLDTLIKSISAWFGGATITLRQDTDGLYSVWNSKGQIDGVRVNCIRQRYRFEMSVT